MILVYRLALGNPSNAEKYSWVPLFMKALKKTCLVTDITCKLFFSGFLTNTAKAGVEPPPEMSLSIPRSRAGAGAPLLIHPPPPFPNILRPPANLPPPNVLRAPFFRIRLPMPGSNDPAVDFPHPGITEAEHWNSRPFRSDWQDTGAPRGPAQWFRPEPPFRHSGWNRGAPWGHGH